MFSLLSHFDRYSVGAENHERPMEVEADDGWTERREKRARWA
jgi:hypothetical protein